MKPAPFEYAAPATLDAALAALEEYGYGAKVLAGGQSLIPAMNFRLMQPPMLVDLNRIPALDYIEPTASGGLRIGGMARHSAVEHSPLVAARAPLLHEAMPHIAHPQIRNRGTIGGSLAHADPAAELPVITIALEARLRLQKRGSERWVDATEFFQYMFTTDIQPNEILTEIDIPPMPKGTGWAFEEFSRRKGDYALAGVAALITVGADGVCHKARLVYLNLGEVPVIAHGAQAILEGEKPHPRLAAEAARRGSEEVEPMGSVHASPEYQRHLARVLTERALIRAFGRAAHG